jgi:tRNA threonylcarbamoyladenosine biosynthesis protein TsaB
MIVLGFDTATSATAVALRLGDSSTSRRRDDPAAGEHPGHATRLLALADELLTEAGVGWGELERIAVGVGPGTFTGLRVGVASARGLAQSLSVGLVGVSSLAALAEAADAPASDAGPPEEGHDALLAVIDARRGEAFAAAYASAPGAIPGELAPARALAPADLAALPAALDAEHGGAPRRWLAVGDGAVRYREQLQAAGVAVPPVGSGLHLLDAGAICAAGARAPQAHEPQEIVPDYHRRPDAELALEGAGRGGRR